MHPPDLLKSIYQEHGQSSDRLAETLLLAGAPLTDVELLRRLPWPYLANRLAVERARLRLPTCPPPFRPCASLSTWPTPAQMVKLFALGLTYEGQDDFPDGQGLVLPA